MANPDSTLNVIDLNKLCPACELDVPPDQMVFIENMTLRCPKCGREWPEKQWGQWHGSRLAREEIT